MCRKWKDRLERMMIIYNVPYSGLLHTCRPVENLLDPPFFRVSVMIDIVGALGLATVAFYRIVTL